MTDTTYDPNDITQWGARVNGQVETPDEEEGSKMTEVPPTILRPPLRERAKERAGEIRESLNRIAPVASKTPLAPRTVTKAKAKPVKPRVSLESLITRGWQMLAQAVQPIAPPVARVLDMQAPVAGMILEDPIKGTIVDKILQPIARVEKGGEIAFALLGPPMLIGALAAKPASAPVVVPLLREALRLWVDIAGPKLAQVKAREEKFKEEYGTQVDDMIDYFLGHTDYPGGPYTDEFVSMMQQQEAENMKPEPMDVVAPDVLRPRKPRAPRRTAAKV